VTTVIVTATATSTATATATTAGPDGGVVGETGGGSEVESQEGGVGNEEAVR
jgi:hypothetical protein